MTSSQVRKILADAKHPQHPYPCPREGCCTVCLGHSAFFLHVKICQLPRKPERTP